MKILKPLSSILLLGVAVAVTVGSMYVTVSAAARQDEVQLDAVPLPGSETQPESIVPPTPATGGGAGSDTIPGGIADVSLDASAGFTGTVSTLSRPGGEVLAAAGLEVRVIQNGMTKATAVTAADGSYAVGGLESGRAGLLAFGPDGLLVTGMKLAAGGQALAEATPVKLMKTLQTDVSSLAVSGPDVQIVRELLMGGLPQGTAVSEAASHELTSYSAGGNNSSALLDHHAVQLGADGSLNGLVNLDWDITDMTVHFVRDGALVASAEVAATGEFQVAGLTPGVHSVVATGQDGTAAISVDILGSQAQAKNKNASEYTLTGLSQGGLLIINPCTNENLNTNNASQVSDGSLSENGVGPGGIGAPIGPGGLGGPGGGALGGPGGGGFGGAPGGGLGGGVGGGLGGAAGGLGAGGGLGALLGAAVAGAVGYAVGEDENDSSPNR